MCDTGFAWSHRALALCALVATLAVFAHGAGVHSSSRPPDVHVEGVGSRRHVDWPAGHTSGYVYAGSMNIACFYDLYYRFNNSDPTLVPLLVFVGSGPPGYTTLSSLFYGGGPTRVLANGTAHNNPYTYQSQFALLYLDQPAHTGFSWTGKFGYYETNQNLTTEHLWLAMSHFIELNSQFVNSPMYFVGEGGWGAKAALDIAYSTWYQNSGPFGPSNNFKGVILGSGAPDLVRQAQRWPTYAFQMGLLGASQRDEAATRAADVEALVAKGSLLEASAELLELKHFLLNATGVATEEDIRATEALDRTPMITYLNQPSMRALLGVGSRETKLQNDLVLAGLLETTLEPNVDRLPSILNGAVRVLVYSGNFDLFWSTYVQNEWVESIPGYESIAEANQTAWQVNGVTAGMVRSVGPLTQISLTQCGRYVAWDQPERALDMMIRWVNNKGWGDL